MPTTNLVLYLPKCMVEEFDYVIERKFINKNEYVTNALKQEIQNCLEKQKEQMILTEK